MKTLPLLLLLLAGCAYNRPSITERLKSPDGSVQEKTLTARTFAIWPATTEMSKQKLSAGKTWSVGTDGFSQETGGTNVVEALRSLDSILSRIH